MQIIYLKCDECGRQWSSELINDETSRHKVAKKENCPDCGRLGSERSKREVMEDYYDRQEK